MYDSRTDKTALPAMTDSQKRLIAGSTVVGGAILFSTIATPAHAQAADPVAAITTMIGSLAALVGVVIAFIVSVMAVRYAIKTVNRMATKG